MYILGFGAKGGFGAGFDDSSRFWRFTFSLQNSLYKEKHILFQCWRRNLVLEQVVDWVGDVYGAGAVSVLFVHHPTIQYINIL